MMISMFGCFSLSRTQILVDPCRADRVIAIGRALAADDIVVNEAVRGALADVKLTSLVQA